MYGVIHQSCLIIFWPDILLLQQPKIAMIMITRDNFIYDCMYSLPCKQFRSFDAPETQQMQLLTAMFSLQATLLAPCWWLCLSFLAHWETLGVGSFSTNIWQQPNNGVVGGVDRWRGGTTSSELQTMVYIIEMCHHELINHL